MRKFTLKAFKGWWNLFAKGIPTYLLNLFSFLSIEIIILMTGYLKDPEFLVANT